jgi:hypothetical protein
VRVARLRKRASGTGGRGSQRGRTLVRAALIAAPTLFAGMLATSAFFAHGPTGVAAARALPTLPIPTPSLPLPTPDCTLLPLPPLCPTPTPPPPPPPPTPTPAPPTPTQPVNTGPATPLPPQGPNPPGGVAPGAANPGSGTTSGIPAPGLAPGGVSAPFSISSPFPTGGVLFGSAPPLPTPLNFSPNQGGSVDQGTADGSMLIPAITDVASPDEVSLNLGSIGQSMLIALVLLALLALPALLVNATIRENRDDIQQWLSNNGSRLKRSGQMLGRIPRVLSLGGVILGGSVLFALLDPAFGLNLTTAAEVMGLLGALLALTFAHDLARRSYVKRRFRTSGRLMVSPAGVVVALCLVLVSRAFHLQPGLIFGLLTGLAFSKRLTDRDAGHSLAVATFLVLAVSFVAWFAWAPVKSGVATSPNPGFWMITLDTLLVTIWVAGVESIVFALIPMRFLDGEKLMAWSRAGWLVIYYLCLFVFVQTIMQPTTERFGEQPSVISLAAALFGLTVVATGVWLYSALRHRRLRRVSPAAG